MASARNWIRGLVSRFFSHSVVVKGVSASFASRRFLPSFQSVHKIVGFVRVQKKQMGQKRFGFIHRSGEVLTALLWHKANDHHPR